MGKRRDARRLAVLALYQADVLSEPVRERTAVVLVDEDADQEQREYVDGLIDLYERHRSAIDRALREAGATWELERMSATDRATLRVAVTELLFMPGIPEPVSLNEAIEIARDYGGEESGRFVNGVLDAVLRRKHEAADEPATSVDVNEQDDAATDPPTVRSPDDPARDECDTH